MNMIKKNCFLSMVDPEERSTQSVAMGTMGRALVHQDDSWPEVHTNVWVNPPKLGMWCPERSKGATMGLKFKLNFGSWPMKLSTVPSRRTSCASSSAIHSTNQIE